MPERQTKGTTANILVIGGTSGIGAALVHRLLTAGATVYSSSRSAAEREPQERLHTAALDVTAEDLPNGFLPDSLDGLAYCPGTIRLRPFRQLSDDSFREDFELNLMGAVRCIRWALPALQSGDGGAVVLFSTVAVQTGMPYHASIASAKGAVEGLARSLAAELAPKVRVNCIAPSLTDTPLAGRILADEAKRSAAADRHPLARVGSADDQAAAAAFLLSSNANWITGQVLGVDGGMGSLRRFT